MVWYVHVTGSCDWCFGILHRWMRTYLSHWCDAGADAMLVLMWCQRWCDAGMVGCQCWCDAGFYAMPVLMRISPSCSHAHSRLILSLSSASELYIDATFTLFPTGTVWLGHPYLRSLTWNSGCIDVHTYYGAGYHIYSMRQIVHAYK